MPRFAALRAKIGATVLDVLRPGWAKEIELRTLNLQSCEVCVLGQLFGEYEKGLSEVFAMTSGRDEQDAMAARAGFNAGYADGSGVVKLPRVPFTALTAAWKNEIRKRKQGRHA